MTIKPTEAMIEAGRCAMRLWLPDAHDDFIGMLAEAAYTAMQSSTPQEPDDDVEWLQRFARNFNPTDEEVMRLERIATRLQAKAPETDWQPIETAPVAMSVLAARFDSSFGEWIMGVVSSQPTRPFAHWQPLPAPPNPPYSGIVDEADFTRGEE